METRNVMNLLLGGLIVCSSAACATHAGTQTSQPSLAPAPVLAAPRPAQGAKSPSPTAQAASLPSTPSPSEKPGQSASMIPAPPDTGAGETPAESDAVVQDEPTQDALSEADFGENQIEDAEDEVVVTYDVPVVRNESVAGYIEYFQVTIRERFEKWLSRSSRYLPTMTKIFRDQGLPEDLVFVALIESGFNPYAYSRAKASGTWQFIRSTGKRYGLTINDWVDERRDPIKSTFAAANYLKDLYGRFGSWPLALASYNAGEGKIQRAIRRTKSDDFWDIKNTRYIRRETKDYVPKFMAATIIAKDPERYGFSLLLNEPLEFDEVVVDRPVTLKSAAAAIGVDPQELKDLNPELKRGVTPPYARAYVLRLPSGTRDTFLANQDKVETYKGPYYATHHVRRGESLSTIARRYGTSVSALKATNHLRSNIIRTGAVLKVPTDSFEREPTRYRRPAAVTKVSSKTSSSDGTNRTVYRVKSGDTLTSIAKDFNVTLSDLRKWNNNRRKNLIRPGDRIVLYTNLEQS